MLACVYVCVYTAAMYTSALQNTFGLPVTDLQLKLVKNRYDI